MGLLLINCTGPILPTCHWVHFVYFNHVLVDRSVVKKYTLLVGFHVVKELFLERTWHLCNTIFEHPMGVCVIGYDDLAVLLLYLS